MSLVPLTLTLPSSCTGFDDLAPAGARPKKGGRHDGAGDQDQEFPHADAPCRGASRRNYGRARRRDCTGSVLGAHPSRPIPSASGAVVPPCGQCRTKTLVAGLASGDREAASAVRPAVRAPGCTAWPARSSTTTAPPRTSPRRAFRAGRGSTPVPSTPAGAASWAGCSPSPATWRSTRCGVRRPVVIDPASLLGYDRRVDRTAAPVTTPSCPRTATDCAAALAQLPEEQSRAVVLAGLLGYNRARGGRDGGHPRSAPPRRASVPRCSASGPRW